MSLLNPCAQRVLEPEVMDDPSLDTEQHRAALRDLARINWLSDSSGIVWSPIRRLAQSTPGQRLRVLDIATGSGDIPLSLWKYAQRAGLQLDLTGVDISETALEVARKRSQQAEAEINFERRDVLQDPPQADYDVVVSSLFMHHLDRTTAVQLLRIKAAAARRLVLVNDLRRSRGGLMLAHLVTRVLTSSPVVRTDAVLSVKAAFTVEEALAVARDAGLVDTEIRRVWPYRFLLQWRRD